MPQFERSLSEVLHLTRITPFRNTHKLWLHDLPQVTDISMLTIVRELALYNMSNVNKGWSSLQENFERLIIDTHNSLTSFSGCAFKKLRYLELKSCERFTGVEAANQVEEINIASCKRLVDITPFRPGVGKVTKITILSCPLITDISPLHGIPHVTVDTKLSGITDYSLLGNHKRLVIVADKNSMVAPMVYNVELHQFKNLSDLSPSSDVLQRLTSLSLHEFFSLRSFIVLPNLINLELHEVHIRKFTAGDDFPNLQVLKLSLCPFLQVIDIQHHLLNWFEVENCTKFFKITMRSKEQRHCFSLLKNQALTVLYAES
jgi:hypothetical protein